MARVTKDQRVEFRAEMSTVNELDYLINKSGTSKGELLRSLIHRRFVREVENDAIASRSKA
jgi:hypothetical protein